MGLVRSIGLTLAITVVAGSTWVALEGHRRFTGDGPLTEERTLVIAKGAGLETIAHTLTAAGVIHDPYSFLIGVKLRQGMLKAGEYAFPARISAQRVMELLQEGKSITHKLTIAEGLTVKRALAEVAEAGFLSGTLTRTPAEGTLMPETWRLLRDDDRNEVVARMERAMQSYLDQAWAKRSPDLPLKSKEEALILASVVERETGLAQERPKVAAVFLNRLKLGMKLQSDPTVIYGLSSGSGILDRPLTRADLETPHPWNTYVIPALPQSPIANPGKASLDAVLHPAQTDALYFVADGKGGHAFARTLEEHNRNVAAWRKNKAVAQVGEETEDTTCTMAVPRLDKRKSDTKK